LEVYAGFKGKTLYPSWPKKTCNHSACRERCFRRRNTSHHKPINWNGGLLQKIGKPQSAIAECLQTEAL